MRANIKVFVLSIALTCGAVIPTAVCADLGNFNVTKACPATVGIHSQDNPGQVTVKAGETYSAVNLNKPGGAYVLLRIPGAQPKQRWIELTCGALSGGPVATGSESPPQTGGEAGAAGKPGKYLLAVSWQPAFCESPAGQDKKECDTESETSFDATHFTLHGLWPQPQGNDYCKVSRNDKSNDERHKWNKLPEPSLSSDTREELDKIMPGTQSNLHRHEWIKHGTCFGTGPEAYFRTANALIGQLNDSQLQRFVQANVGNEVDAADLRDAFEQTFGKGSAGALAVECSKDNGRVLISGISINLQGVLDQSSRLQDVLDISKNFKPKCARGEIDPVGEN